MARVRNKTGEDRYVPEARRVIPDDGVMDVPDDRADAWDAQPGWDVEVPPKTRSKKDKE